MLARFIAPVASLAVECEQFSLPRLRAHSNDFSRKEQFLISYGWKQTVETTVLIVSSPAVF